MRLPRSSRGMQNLQHLAGGISQILLVTLGVAFGQKDVFMGIVLSILAFLANRASSEISYQTSIRVMDEYTENREQKNADLKIVMGSQQIQKNTTYLNMQNKVS